MPQHFNQQLNLDTSRPGLQTQTANTSGAGAFGQGPQISASGALGFAEGSLDAFLPTDVTRTQQGQQIRQLGQAIPGGTWETEALKAGVYAAGMQYDIFSYLARDPEFDQVSTPQFQAPDLYYNQNPTYDLAPYEQQLQQQVETNKGILEGATPMETSFSSFLKTGHPVVSYTTYRKAKANKIEAMKQFAIQNKGVEQQLSTARAVRGAQVQKYQDFERKESADRFRRESIIKSRQGLYDVNY